MNISRPTNARSHHGALKSRFAAWVVGREALSARCVYRASSTSTGAHSMNKGFSTQDRSRAWRTRDVSTMPIGQTTGTEVFEAGQKKPVAHCRGRVIFMNGQHRPATAMIEGNLYQRLCTNLSRMVLALPWQHPGRYTRLDMKQE